MLIFRYIYAVYSIIGIDKTLATITVVFPFSHAELFARLNAKSESITMSMFPLSFIVRPVISHPRTMTMRMEQRVSLACIDTFRVCLHYLHKGLAERHDVHLYSIEGISLINGTGRVGQDLR